MLKVVRGLLQMLIDDIDSGNTNITEDESIEIADFLGRFAKNTAMSKYQAYTFLGISRATFDNLVKEGKLPEGKKVEGFKEKFWYRGDLKKYIKKNG